MAKPKNFKPLGHYNFDKDGFAIDQRASMRYLIEKKSADLTTVHALRLEKKIVTYLSTLQLKQLKHAIEIELAGRRSQVKDVTAE